MSDEILAQIMAAIKKHDKSCTCCGPTEFEDTESELRELFGREKNLRSTYTLAVAKIAELEETLELYRNEEI